MLAPSDIAERGRLLWKLLGKIAKPFVVEQPFVCDYGYNIEAGADVNAKDEYGKTALMIAAKSNSADIAQLLIVTEANVNAKNKGSDTALMYATAYNAADIARHLLSAGTDVNTQNKIGKTALMYAAGNNYADVAELLIVAGADKNVKDNEGKTALMIATDLDSDDVAEVLKAAGARQRTADCRVIIRPKKITMKTKKHFIAALMLIALFMSCQSTRVQKSERSNALI